MWSSWSHVPSKNMIYYPLHFKLLVVLDFCKCITFVIQLVICYIQMYSKNYDQNNLQFEIMKGIVYSKSIVIFTRVILVSS
jgi:uncharacterized membrane protein YjjP (DUF1212 family)